MGGSYLCSGRGHLQADRARQRIRVPAPQGHDPCHCYRGPPISARTFEGSFSAVWVPTIARVGAFFHIFRDLQDSHSFAPLHSQIFVNFSFLFLQNHGIIKRNGLKKKGFFFSGDRIFFVYTGLYKPRPFF